jgi:hypothetical protein
MKVGFGEKVERKWDVCFFGGFFTSFVVNDW